MRTAGRRTCIALAALSVLGPTWASAGTLPASAQQPAPVIPLLREGVVGSIPTATVTKDNFASYIDFTSCDTLMSYASDGRLVPDLATSDSQPSDVTYVYDIRHGVKFWDGSPLTATDVAFSLNLERAPGSPWAFFFPSVKSVTATSPYEVTVELSYPNATWPGDVPGAFIFEKRFAQEHKATFGQPGTLIMCSGPWEVDSLDPTTGAQFSANPDWWRGRVPVEHISLTSFASETSLALAMRAGEIDVDTGVATPKAFAATAGSEAALLSVPNPAYIGSFTMNTQVAPWDDIHVRRAVAYVLDRANIITAQGGYAVPSYTLIPAESLRTIASEGPIDALLKTINLYPHSVAKARQEMAASDYHNGASTTIVVWTPSAVDPAEVIVAELHQIGINARLQVLTFPQWLTEATGPPAKRPAMYTTWSVANSDPNSYMSLLGTANLVQGQFNVADYAPPGLDAQIKAGISTDNDPERFSAYATILKRLSLDVPYVGLFDGDAVVALSKAFSWPSYGPYSTEGFWPLGVTSATR
jgi:peptide/nickel transport system substrate-binding protein